MTIFLLTAPQNWFVSPADWSNFIGAYEHGSYSFVNFNQIYMLNSFFWRWISTNFVKQSISWGWLGLFLTLFSYFLESHLSLCSHCRDFNLFASPDSKNLGWYSILETRVVILEAGEESALHDEISWQLLKALSKFICNWCLKEQSC